jgi:type IV secretory pathway VirB10-like protein
MPPPKELFDQSPKNIVQNNKILIIVGFLVVTFILFYFMFAAQKNEKTVVKESGPKPNLSLSTAKDDTPDWMVKHKDEKPFIIQAYSKPQTQQEIEKQVIKNDEIELNKQISDDKTATKLEIQKIEDQNKIDEKKMEYAAEQAPMTIAVPAPPGTSSGSQATSTDLGNEINKLSGSAEAAKEKSADDQKLGGDINDQDEKLAFLNKPEIQNDYLKNGLQRLKSPYEIKAGSTIPAALIFGINTDMPGSVVAQVRANVYDTVTGNYILIPQGTKVVGEYDSKVTYGQSRVEVVWDRLIFPDGNSIDLERMQGADLSGMAGFSDKLNNHYFKLYSNALLLSFVGAGYDVLNNQQSQNSPYSAQQAVAANVGQQLSNVASKSIEKNMDVQPTITISPGYQFNILVMKDMILNEIKDTEGTLDIQGG